MIHPHDPLDKSEPWTIRVTSIAHEFTKKGHWVKLCYFPLALNKKHLPGQINAVELVPLDRNPSPLVFFKNIKTLLSLCEWADIVHFQKCHHYASVPAVIAAYIKKKPLHYDWDDWEEKIWFESCGRGLHSRFIGFSFKVLERTLPVLADSVSCASGHLKSLAERFGVRGVRLSETPVGADMEKFNPSISGEAVRKKHELLNHEEIVLYVGQLHGAQYVDLFIKAANIILHKRPNTRFFIVGEGFMEWKLRRMVHELGLGSRVIFTGSVPHSEIPFYIAAATVCVAPFKDTLVTRCKSPLKIVEYMAMGKAIVASDVGEVRKMLGGVGILTSPGDHNAMAEGILLALEDPELRKNLEKASRERAELRYDWPKTAATLLAAYEKIR